MPPELRFEFPLLRELSDADRALGELAGVGRMLPNPYLLIQPFLSREAVLSSRIEGTVTQLDQLLLFDVRPEDVPQPADAQEVRNYVRAAHLGLERISQGQPLTLALIRDLHGVLLGDVRGADQRPGQVRDRPVFIGRPGQTFDTARFVPPCHTALAPLLDDFARFLRDEPQLPVVVQLALVHYQFETIHPFNDGNGRIGRLLITLMLCARGILPTPLLYLSAYFERDRDAYYDGLLAVSRQGAWAEWVGYFARGIAEQARDAAGRARRLLDLWEEYQHRAVRAVKSPHVLKLVDALFDSPYMTAARAEAVTGLAYKNALAQVQKLVAGGILREQTGQRRNRVYVADEILARLNESEPPPAG